MENNVEKKRRLRREYLEDLFESLPTMEIAPLPGEFVRELLRAGAVVVGGRGTGKTNLVKIILSQIVNDQHGIIQVKIVDSCQNWVHGFESIHYQHINENLIFSQGVSRGADFSEVYFGEDHFLYDLEFWDLDILQDVIASLVIPDYDVQRIYKKHHLMNNWILWTIEEAQNILGTYALNSKQGKRWLKLISESRNFNMNFIFIGQRLADMSTKAIERCQNLLMGRMTGDNDLKKIQRICGKEAGIHEMVPKLRVPPEGCDFIFWNGEEAVKLVNIPRYQVTTTPILWERGVGI